MPDGNGMRIVLPGDPAYERAPCPTRRGVPLGDFNEAVREVSMRANRKVLTPRRGHGRREAERAASMATIPAVPDFGIGPAPEPGRVDEVAPGVLRLTAPNPGS